MFSIFSKLEKCLCLRNEKGAGREPIPSLSSGSHCLSHNSPISQETTAGAGNSDFIWEDSKPRWWWTHVPKNHLAWVRIQASFILKREGVKSNTSWFPSAFGGNVLISSFCSRHRWAWSGCFLWAKQRCFSLMLITWEAGFPEMGRYV